MGLQEIFLCCLTIIEFNNLIIRIIKLSPILNDIETKYDSYEPELTEEMRGKIYS